MATTAELIALNDTAIEGLYAALADEAMESYTTPDGRSYSRAQFAPTLKTLLEVRRILRDEAILDAKAARKRVHLASLGFARRSGR